MNLSKFAKQFKEVIDQSYKNNGSCVCLEITDKSASLSGVSRKKIAPQSALLFIRKNDQTFVKGVFDEVYIESSSIEDLDSSDSILLGIDCRTKENNIVYYKSGKTIDKVSSSSSMNSDDALYIFWEHGPYASLTVCAYDPIQDEVIREIVSASNEPMKRFLRAIVRQALPPYEKETEDYGNLLDLEDESKEEMDSETELEWEE